MNGRTILSAALALLMLSASTSGAELIELVPDNPLAVLQMSKADELWQTVKNSPHAARLQAHGPAALKEGFGDLGLRIENIEAMFVFDMEATLGGLLGDDAVLAVLGPRRWVLLSRNEELERLTASLNDMLRVMRTTGAVRGEQVHVHEGININQLQIGPGLFHCMIDDTVVVGSHIDIIKSVIDKSKLEKDEDAPVAEWVEALAPDDNESWLRLYLDSDRIGRLINIERLLTERPQQPGLQFMASHLATLLPLTRYTIIALSPAENGAEIRTSFTYNEDAMPETYKAMVPQETDFEILQLAPESAVMAFAASVDKQAVWDHVIESLRLVDEQSADDLQLRAKWIGAMIGGLDFETEILPKLGDQSAIFLTSHEGIGTAALTFATDLNEGAPIVTGLRTLVGTLMAFARQGARDGVVPVTLERATVNTIELTTVRFSQPELGAHLSPTLYASDKTLFISTNADAPQAFISRFNKKDDLELPEVEGVIGSYGNLYAERLQKMIENVVFPLAKERGSEITNDHRAAAKMLELLDKLTVYTVHNPGRLDRVLVVKFAELVKE